MIQLYCTILILFLNFSCKKEEINKISIKEKEDNIIIKKEEINKNNTWIFPMLGQSNMAGRAIVESVDNFMINDRIKFIDLNGDLVIAKEPLHKYEPNIKGLDCGLSFAIELLKRIPDSITIILVPCAVGGSSINEWLNDLEHNDIKLLTNFKNRLDIAKQYGIIKGILWHQGESDANNINILTYETKLNLFFNKIRIILNNEKLPIYVGQLGSFLHKRFGNYPNQINEILNNVSGIDKNTYIINTLDFTDVGDSLHFDSKSQRLMGKRFANQIKL